MSQVTITINNAIPNQNAQKKKCFSGCRDCKTKSKQSCTRLWSSTKFRISIGILAWILFPFIFNKWKSEVSVYLMTYVCIVKFVLNPIFFCGCSALCCRGWIVCLIPIIVSCLTYWIWSSTMVQNTYIWNIQDVSQVINNIESS